LQPRSAAVAAPRGGTSHTTPPSPGAPNPEPSTVTSPTGDAAALLIASGASAADALSDWPAASVALQVTRPAPVTVRGSTVTSIVASSLGTPKPA
jgi:hypothetical protein